jgi:hypothetical protein
MADKLSGLRRGGPASGVMTRLMAPRHGDYMRASVPAYRLTLQRRAATMRCRSASTCR